MQSSMQRSTVPCDQHGRVDHGSRHDPLLSDLLFDQMAATIIGGLVAATVLSLFVMPALYRLTTKEEVNEPQAELLTQ